MNQRQSNFEALRILSMLMVISLHYLDKGGVLQSAASVWTAPRAAAWLLEAFCLVAVNVYVLLTGYFGCKLEFRPAKLLAFWKQLLFYSVAVAFACFALGISPLSDLNVYRVVGYLFPAVTNEYWFATSYLLLLLLAPFLNQGIQTLAQKNFERLLLLLLLFFSAAKTVLPMRLPYDDGGYNVLWFLVLYLTGAYLREFGSTLPLSAKGSALLYAGSCAGIFALTLLLKTIAGATGHLEELVGYAYAYNHLFCFTGAVGLFSLFCRLKLRRAGAERLICRLSPATFGVYLLHEHPELRYRWPRFLGTERASESFLWIPHWIFSVLAVYFVCAGAELLRQRLFAAFEKRNKEKGHGVHTL